MPDVDERRACQGAPLELWTDEVNCCPKEIIVAPVDAPLMFVDGHTLKVLVQDPPPETFKFAMSPTSHRVLFLRRYSANGAIYVERDRRKSALPVEQERRRRRSES